MPKEVAIPTSSVVGFPGSVDHQEWSRLWAQHLRLGADQGVVSGLAVTPAAGTRAVAVAAGRAVMGGLEISVPATTLNADAATSARLDAVVLEAVWGATLAECSARLAFINGTATVAPPGTRTPGVLWQMPLARTSLAAGATTFTEATVEDIGPLPRRTRVPDVNSFTGRIVAPGGAPEAVASLTLRDPGWAYRPLITAAHRFETGGGAMAAGQAGYGVLIAEVDGVEVGRTQTDRMEPNTGVHTARLTTWGRAVSGSRSVVRLLVGEIGGIHAVTVATSPANEFEVAQVPAP